MAKKIGAIVSLSIIGILILATIIMANIKVDYSINCETPTFVYVSYNLGTERDADQLQATDKIIKYINNASNEKSLTALFNGTLGKKAEIFAVKESTIKDNSGFLVRYRYENKQKLMNGDEAYKTSNNKNVYYDDLVFTVNNVEGVSVVKVYVVQDSANSMKYTYYYELEADFEDLYNYLDEKFN